MVNKSHTEAKELTDLIYRSLVETGSPRPKYVIRATLEPFMADPTNPQEKKEKIEGRFDLYRNLQDKVLKERVMEYVLGDALETNGRVIELIDELGEEEKLPLLYKIIMTNSKFAEKAIEVLFEKKSPAARYLQALVLAQTGNPKDKKAALVIADSYESFGLTPEQAQNIIDAAEASK